MTSLVALSGPLGEPKWYSSYVTNCRKCKGSPEKPLQQAHGSILIDTLVGGDISAAQGLVLAGVELNHARDNYGRAALHIAAERGNVGLTRLLCQHGADPNAFDPSGLTALHYATMQGHTSLMQLLIDSQASVNEVSLDGETPLSICAGDGNLKAVQILLRAKAIAEVAEHQCSQRAAIKGYAKCCVKACSQMGCVSPLLRAVENNADCEVVAALLTANACVSVTDCEYNQPIHLAVINRNMRTVRVLLMNAADPSACNFAWRTPIQCVPDTASSRIAKLLLEHRASIENEEVKNKPTPFEIVQEHQRESQLQKLVGSRPSHEHSRRLVGATSTLQQNGQSLLNSASEPSLSQCSTPPDTRSVSFANGTAGGRKGSRSSPSSPQHRRRVLPRTPSLSKVAGAVLSPPSSPATRVKPWDRGLGSQPSSPSSTSSPSGNTKGMGSLPPSPTGVRRSMGSLSTEIGPDSLSSFSGVSQAGFAGRHGHSKSPAVAWG